MVGVLQPKDSRNSLPLPNQMLDLFHLSTQKAKEDWVIGTIVDLWTVLGGVGCNSIFTW